MDPSQKQCHRCQAFSPANMAFCQRCGQPFAPPLGQAAAPMGQAVAPMGQAVAPMGQQAPQAPVPGAPGYYGAQQPPPPGGYPYGPSGYGYSNGSPAPKRKGKGKAIVAVLLALVLIGGGVGAVFALRGGGAPPVAGYSDVRTLVCGSQTPEGLAAKEGRLEDYDKTHPGEVESDLSALMDACIAYAKGDPQDTARYVDMLAKLDTLSASSVGEVARCAKRLAEEVVQAQTANAPAPPVPVELPDVVPQLPPLERPSSPTPQNQPESQPESQPAEESGYLPLEVPSILAAMNLIDGVTVYTFPVDNYSGKDILWCEFMVFCYDAYAQPCAGNNGTNWEWVFCDTAIPQAASLDYGELGIWPLNNCPDASIMLPVCSYVIFADGTTWGFSDDNGAITADVLEWSAVLGAYSDAILAEILSNV